MKIGQALNFAITIAVAAFTFWLGMVIEYNHSEATRVATEKAHIETLNKVFTIGFDDGVTCGLLAYTQDPSETELPVVTARAHAWYITLRTVQLGVQQAEDARTESATDTMKPQKTNQDPKNPGKE